jgi:hypothetical protein
LSKWFQTRRFLWEFPIGPYVKLSSAVAAILVGVLKCRTQFWKRTTHESFQQSLVEIGSVVSEEKFLFKFHPPFFLICIIGKNRQKFKVHKKSNSHKHFLAETICSIRTNFDEMILGRSPFKVVSVSAVLYPRWLPLLKIEISSNGQNWSILSQKVPKFEILVGSRDHRTQFWKGAIQGSFHKCLLAIGPVVSEEKIFM